MMIFVFKNNRYGYLTMNLQDDQEEEEDDDDEEDEESRDNRLDSSSSLAIAILHKVSDLLHI